MFTNSRPAFAPGMHHGKCHTEHGKSDVRESIARDWVYLMAEAMFLSAGVLRSALVEVSTTQQLLSSVIVVSNTGMQLIFFIPSFVLCLTSS